MHGRGNINPEHDRCPPTPATVKQHVCHSHSTQPTQHGTTAHGHQAQHRHGLQKHNTGRHEAIDSRGVPRRALQLKTCRPAAATQLASKPSAALSSPQLPCPSGTTHSCTDPLEAPSPTVRNQTVSNFFVKYCSPTAIDAACCPDAAALLLTQPQRSTNRELEGSGKLPRAQHHSPQGCSTQFGGLPRPR